MGEWINVADKRPYIGSHPWVTLEYNNERTVERLFMRKDGFARHMFSGYTINEHVVAWKTNKQKPEPYTGNKKEIRSVWKAGR